MTKLADLLDPQDRDPLYGFQVTLRGDPGVFTTESDLLVRFNANDTTRGPSAKLRSWVSVLDVQHPKDPAAVSSDEYAVFVAQQVRGIFSDEQTSIAYTLKDSPYAHHSASQDIPSDRLTALEKRSTRAFKYASSYHLTFSLFAASASPSAWDIETAIDEFLDPLLTPLSAISTFTVDTQVQLYASFSPSIVGPQYDDTEASWKLLQSDLSGFINAAEWPLSPSIGSGPTINFVLYVPSADQTPMVVAETGGNSWIIPQWGGVQILNRSPQSNGQRLDTAELENVMLTFADQLTSLLGLPPSPSSLQLRIRSLARERTTSLILSASSTLGALVRLTNKLESIAIPASVAQSVASTITHLDQACEDLGAGRFQRALANARTAEEEAEKAFFEPSMVGQVYFPDEHKVAVYVPLLGPMAVPLVMAALKEIRKLREGKLKSA